VSPIFTQEESGIDAEVNGQPITHPGKGPPSAGIFRRQGAIRAIALPGCERLQPVEHRPRVAGGAGDLHAACAHRFHRVGHTRNDGCVAGQHLHHLRLELRIHLLDVTLLRRRVVQRYPLFFHFRLFEQLADVVFLCQTHVPANQRAGSVHAKLMEDVFQGIDRGNASVIDNRPGPVEKDRGDFCAG
jgi:hypothetical protein